MDELQIAAGSHDASLARASLGDVTVTVTLAHAAARPREEPVDDPPVETPLLLYGTVSVDG